MAHGRIRLARWLGIAGLVAAAAAFTAAAGTDSFLISSFILGWGSALAAVLFGFAAALGYIALANEAPPCTRRASYSCRCRDASRPCCLTFVGPGKLNFWR
jgi:hypothetical protein